MAQNRQNLNKVLSRMDVITMAFGTMIGWGWFFFPVMWINEAGVLGAAIAFAIVMVMCLFVASSYAKLTPAFPLAGGEMVFAYRGLGYFGSWVAAWSIAFAYLGVAAWEGIAFTTAVHSLVPIPRLIYLWTIAGSEVYLSWVIIGMAPALFLMTLNYLGMRPSVILQVSATAGLIFAGLLFIFGAITFGDIKNTAPLFTTPQGILAVLIVAPSMFVGFDIIPQLTEEMNIPLTQIPKIFTTAILMAGLWYILIIAATGLAAPLELRIDGNINASHAITYAYHSPLFGKILICGVLCGILTSLNGFFMAATRVLFAMGRAKMIPDIFGRIPNKRHTPNAAILLVGFICATASFFGQHALTWLVNSSSFCTMLAYFCVALSFLMIRAKEKNLPLSFVNPPETKRFHGYAALVVTILFLSLYLPWIPGTPISAKEWILLCAWSVFGIVLALAANRKYGKILEIEREYMIFGEEYSRFENK